MIPPLTRAQQEIKKKYSGVLQGVTNIDDVLTIRSLFTISFYMMVKYKADPALCSNISYYFELISQGLRAWQTINGGYNPIAS